MLPAIRRVSCDSRAPDGGEHLSFVRLRSLRFFVLNLRNLRAPDHTPTNKDNAKRALSSIHCVRSTKPASSPIRSI
jgi:hypothetical protein